MKKIITLAIAAFLMGGFCLNANAQGNNRKAQNDNSSKKVTTTETTDANKVVAGNWEAKVKEYETTVEKTVAAYKELQDGKTTKTDKFDKLLKKAENLKTELEKAKDQMDRELVERVARATKNLSVVYKKG